MDFKTAAVKCDELKAETIVPQGCTITLQMYPKAEADAAIAELKAENAQLKKETEFMHSNCKRHAGDGCARLLGEKLAIIDNNVKLKQKLFEKDAEIESLKASHYAEMVDAGMRERRMRRELWLARADRAMMTLDYFTLKCRWFKDYMKVEPPGCDVKMVHKWANVERKCREKAEEYK